MVVSPSEVELCNPPSKEEGREISGDIAQTNRLASAAAAAAAARRGQVRGKNSRSRLFQLASSGEDASNLFSAERRRGQKAQFVRYCIEPQVQVCLLHGEKSIPAFVCPVEDTSVHRAIVQ